MKRDGTPETDLEKFFLRAGVGRFVLASGMAGEFELTRAQAHELSKSHPQPETDALHRALYDYFTHSHRVKA